MEIEKGFYYHYKHDPNGPIDDAAYELLGRAFNTESGGTHSDDPSDFLEDEVVVYRPLFRESLAYKAGGRFWTRPVKMFLEEVSYGDARVLRFQKIADPSVLAVLEKNRREMYGE